MTKQSNFWKIEIENKPGIFDAVGSSLKDDIKDLGIKGVEGVRFIQVYLLDGDISGQEARRVAEELLTDPVTEQYRLYDRLREPERQYLPGTFKGGYEEKNIIQKNTRAVTVAYNPGVMDPVEYSARKAINDLGIRGVKSVRTARKYLLKGHIPQGQLKTISDKLLMNKVIQHMVKDEESFHNPEITCKFELKDVRILGSDAGELINISSERQLFMNLNEMQVIQAHFKKLGRNPTDAELETIAQTWSEHCGHKTFRGLIEYTGDLPDGLDGGEKRRDRFLIDSLLKSTIMRVTSELNFPWCVSVFKDNAGIIEFDEEDNVCFKVETHNHPSALEPYGGAGTGIGGVIRDPLGTGLGARPILNTDVFCFGPPDFPFNKLPAGVLHPMRVMKGVVSGVRDYGNRMGIPTANGAICFDEGFVCNPLVYCGNVGIIPRDKCEKTVDKGDLIVLAGGRTGRDGIHGATFSSAELTVESEKISSGAVQIGNPITEKKLADVLIKARDRGLYKAITDCGGGGLSSAVGEIGQNTGVCVDLEKVPLKYSGLSYTEIWISEAQERMILSVSPEKKDELLGLFESEDVEGTVIGRFTGDHRLILRYDGNIVCDLEMEFLHDGLPRLIRKAAWESSSIKEPDFSSTGSLTGYLKKVLSTWNVSSKESVIRQYDHEVQGQTVLKPLVGKENDGPSDACIITPKLGRKKGVIISNGLNPRYGMIDPYWMAASAIDEALRQIISVGGNLKRVAILDNFCWGNTDKPDRMGGLVRAAYACYHAAGAYRIPFISGKDSLNNEYSIGGETKSIPPTLLISAIAVMEDVTRAVSMDVKKPGDSVYIVGRTYQEMGGSQYYLVRGHTGNSVPKVNLKEGRKLMDALSASMEKGIVAACHDCSEGGLGVAAAEMAFAGGMGMDINLKDVPLGEEIHRDDFILFSESNTRFLIEVKKGKEKTFENLLKGMPFAKIGRVRRDSAFNVYGLKGKPVIKADIKDLKKVWQKPLGR